MAELYQYISEDELTHEFGGSLQYKHQDWVRFRMVSLSHFCYNYVSTLFTILSLLLQQVEPFICDVVSVSIYLMCFGLKFLVFGVSSSLVISWSVGHGAKRRCLLSQRSSRRVRTFSTSAHQHSMVSRVATKSGLFLNCC